MANADKRSVATDALETLGNVIDASAKRDAIHLAVEPAIAAHMLRPGEDVGILPNGQAGSSADPVGIVDPFLKRAVGPGEHFWLVVYPRKITSLRHVWTHPAFDSQPTPEPAPPAIIEPPHVIKSREWMEKVADQLGFEPEEVIEHATEYLGNGRYWSEGGTFEGMSIPKDFWSHYSVITGRFVPEDDRDNFFSCSC